MRFIIIADSSLDMDSELENSLAVRKVPFRIMVGGEEFVDDGTLDVGAMLQKVAASKDVARTAAPAPYEFSEAAGGKAEGAFFVTISSKLSASYNSAAMACQELKERLPGLKTAVVDSRAASVGETRLAMEIRRLEAEGKSFEETRDAVEKLRDESGLVFLLDNLETLIKNGRMSRLAGLFATFLHIKPILLATSDGQIGLKDKARTSKKALAKLAESILELKRKGSSSLLVSHANALGKAEALVSLVKSGFSETRIVPMGGLSSTYANEGGLICSF
jgi:DegV family protein with EDD domain